MLKTKLYHKSCSQELANGKTIRKRITLSERYNIGVLGTSYEEQDLVKLRKGTAETLKLSQVRQLRELLESRQRREMQTD